MAAAYAALVSLMHTIHEIQHHHAPPILLDQKQVQTLTQNITFLQWFLELYNPTVLNDESADPLEMRIADAAYAAEDVIESHVIDTIQQRIRMFSAGAAEDVFESHVINAIEQHMSMLFGDEAEDAMESQDMGTIQRRIGMPNQTNLTTRLFNFFYSPKSLHEKLQQAIEEMDSTKKMAMRINTANKAASSSISVSSTTGPDITTAVVVGFDDASLQIMEKLTEDRPDRQVIPIVGMGGIGKTTLARHTYAQKLTLDHFDICAWVTISQQYNSTEILCEIYSQVNKEDKGEVSGIIEAKVIGSKLHKCLFGRRFLVVMDDMWSVDAWDSVQPFFPNNQNGSRIIVTTRLLELSSQLNNDYCHQVGFLDEASSWDLFSKVVFGEKNTCPRELETIGKKIVDGCRGLPLSISVVGGLLKKTDATEQCWESIGSNLTSVVNLRNDKHCLRLLRLSYNHLPLHLKPCLLYMGVFEEDADIKVSALVKLWISERFLKPMYGECLKISATRLLKDLVDRNLVLVSKLGSTGNIKSCKIHDLVRDLCLKEGHKDGFYHVIGQRGGRRINRLQRRVVIPRNASEGKVLGDLRSMPRARSVICEEGKVPKCYNIALLRIFHSYKFVLSKDPKDMHSLALHYTNLRHLTISFTHMPSFLWRINHFWNLHTLIVLCHNYSVLVISGEIWEMPQLRHIELVSYNLCLPDPPRYTLRDVIIMENLQVLKGVRNFKCCRGVVKRIPNIKKLKIHFTEIVVGTKAAVGEYYGISNFEFLRRLESLSLDFTLECSGCLCLQNLTFPQSLKKLSIDFNKPRPLETLSFDIDKKIFDWEDSVLEKIGSLPFLEKLTLKWGFFGTGRWEIVEGQFPYLKYLRLYLCNGLEHWTAAEEGSFIFPCLEHIHLSHLKHLESIPCEIGNIATLQKISIVGCRKSVTKSAREIEEEQLELQGDPLPFCVEVTNFFASR